MTEKEILEMSIDQLNYAVCNWMEQKPPTTKTYAVLDREDGGNYTNWNISSMKRWWGISIDISLVHSHQMFEIVPDWDPAREPSLNIEEAFEVEQKIKEAGLRVNYIQALQKIISMEKMFFGTCIELFELAHATPEQRCRAAMIAVANKSKECENEKNQLRSEEKLINKKEA